MAPSSFLMDRFNNNFVEQLIDNVLSSSGGGQLKQFMLSDDAKSRNGKTNSILERYRSLKRDN